MPRFGDWSCSGSGSGGGSISDVPVSSRPSSAGVGDLIDEVLGDVAGEVDDLLGGDGAGGGDPIGPVGGGDGGGVGSAGGDGGGGDPLVIPLPDSRPSTAGIYSQFPTSILSTSHPEKKKQRRSLGLAVGLNTHTSSRSIMVETVRSDGAAVGGDATT